MNLDLKPSLLRWARERASLDRRALATRLKKTLEAVEAWETTGTLSFSLAEKLAKTTHTPFGFLFLAEPPEEKLPIPDFRTVGDHPVRRASTDLIDTIYAMQRRQLWMREELEERDAAPLGFIGSADAGGDPAATAAAMLAELGYTRGWADEPGPTAKVFGVLRDRVESAGVMVVVNGVVGNDTGRVLDPAEFRGFALCDPIAPLVFVNGADAFAARVFTLVHELAHLYTGTGGVSGLDPAGESAAPAGSVERFCNRVAAEFLLPEKPFRERWDGSGEASDSVAKIAKAFKVSRWAAARRAFELGFIERETMSELIAIYMAEGRARNAKSSQGNFHNLLPIRTGRLLGRAVVEAVKAGRLSYLEGYRLTGTGPATFDRYATNVAARA